jgi:hypothetical protein
MRFGGELRSTRHIDALALAPCMPCTMHHNQELARSHRVVLGAWCAWLSASASLAGAGARGPGLGL